MRLGGPFWVVLGPPGRRFGTFSGLRGALGEPVGVLRARYALKGTFFRHPDDFSHRFGPPFGAQNRPKVVPKGSKSICEIIKNRLFFIAKSL